MKSSKIVISMKAVFIVVLLSAFLFWFGVPSIQRYLESETHIVTTIRVTKGVPSPAVTICGSWKDTTTNAYTQSEINHTCSSFDDIEACIENNTVQFGEVVSSALQIQKGQNVSLRDSYLWKEDFTGPYSGKCFTFESPSVLSSNFLNDNFVFKLKQDPSYTYIHDPKYFVLNYNPSMPFIFKAFGKSIPSPILRLQMTRHHKKNLLSRPCEENQEYIFQVL